MTNNTENMLDESNCEKWENYANDLNFTELQTMIESGFSINCLLGDEVHLITHFINKHKDNHDFFSFLVTHKEHIDWFVKSKSLPITPMFTLLCDENLSDTQRDELLSPVSDESIIEYIKTLDPEFTLSQKSTLKNLNHFFKKYENQLNETIISFKETQNSFIH